MIPWQMVVSVYRQADAAPGDTPHACVHLNMRQEVAQIQGTDVLFTSGTLFCAFQKLYLIVRVDSENSCFDAEVQTYVPALQGPHPALPGRGFNPQLT